MQTFYFYKKRLTKNAGFTLIEVLVAISIFTLSILAMMIVLGNNLSSTNHAKQKAVATYLAEEGIEYIRNIRDTYALYNTNTNGWIDFQGKVSVCDEATNSNGCYFDDQNLNFTAPSQQAITQIDVNVCPQGSCPTLFYHAGSGNYDYSSIGGVDSGFSRKITIKKVQVCNDPSLGCTDLSTDEIQITSKVTWTTGLGVQEVSFSDNLFNWIQP